MSGGMARETVICGKQLRVGDWVKVRYEGGKTMKGSTVEGKIVELWDRDIDNHCQARVESGWCFHNWDTILEHRNVEEGAR